MKDIDTFRYSLNFRNLAGGSRSFEDLSALRGLLVEEAQRVSAVLGAAATMAWVNDNRALAEDLDHHKAFYVGLLEADVMAIDAFLASRKK